MILVAQLVFDEACDKRRDATELRMTEGVGEAGLR